ncbi:MAG TPA: aminodeoxychorismate synthase component I [Solirubrobacteraceae bacterium]|jgi:para-aminobenzoate synthetase|nr:aminodeoxychorismate synthase component I [Solirubrobacteraceae bacterium]
MSTLLVDNYDSYTYNVFHLLAAVSGEEPIVVHNDMVSWAALSRWDFDAIVISPGPGRPDRWHDFGVCADVIRHADVPVLGVCLGHQGLGHALEGAVEAAPLAMHGRLSRVEHDGRGLFEGIPQGFSVVRYHSLAVDPDLGGAGRVLARTEDGVVMAIEHRTRPMWGVQFHPESVATEHGQRLIENFYELARKNKPAHPRGRNRPLVPPRRCRQRSADSGFRLATRTIDGEPPLDVVFERLFGEREYAFWLDSADAPSTLAQRSYVGTTDGPNQMVLEYDVEAGTVTQMSNEGMETEQRSIFDVLSRELQARSIDPPRETMRGLLGGFVGFLGYECKADCGSPNRHRSDMPDAVFVFANRLVAVDHVRHRTTLIAVYRGDELAQADLWLDEAEISVRESLAGTSASASPESLQAEGDASPLTISFQCGRGQAQYLEDIRRCQAALVAGESYEVCLTDQIHTDAHPDPWALYRTLRRLNPSPFAAFLKLGENTIASSSPERFLSIDRDLRVEARPIKGTIAREVDPTLDDAARSELLSDEKTFAEHLMIVDLLRNDLGRMCEIDTVRVPEFMVVEPYTTVHQLISTITGVLDRDRTPVDCVRACFPGGSMTGAPKLRTMEIIDGIEREARGVYSGGLGYFGLDGQVDLSIVIRTIALRPGDTTIGAGGAIVMQSDPQEEFDELLLKARAPMTALAEAVTGRQEAAFTVDVEPERAKAGAV